MIVIDDLTLLVVEDNISTQFLLNALLSRMKSAKVVFAKNGQEAIETINLRYRQNSPIHLMITDWNMSPINGGELAKWVRTSPNSPNKNLPIIMISDFTSLQLENKMGDLVIQGHITKPFTFETISKTIANAIGLTNSIIAAKL